MIKRDMLCSGLDAFVRPEMIGRPSSKLIVFFQPQHLLGIHCGAITILGTGDKVWAKQRPLLSWSFHARELVDLLEAQSVQAN